MQNVIKYLISNPESFKQVKEENACLIGISKEQERAILEVFIENEGDTRESYFWK